MFEALLILYIIFNIIALSMPIMCSVCALIGNLRVNKMVTAKFALPQFSECKPAFIKTCIVTGVFLLINWIFFSDGYMSKSMLPGVEVLLKASLVFSFIWAIVLAALIIMEIVFNFIKNKKYSAKDTLTPVIIVTAVCFVLTFIVA